MTLNKHIFILYSDELYIFSSLYCQSLEQCSILKQVFPQKCSLYKYVNDLKEATVNKGVEELGSKYPKARI